ncbi:unnamed protein product [Sphagnum tenellum]
MEDAITPSDIGGIIKLITNQNNCVAEVANMLKETSRRQQSLETEFRQMKRATQVPPTQNVKGGKPTSSFPPPLEPSDTSYRKEATVHYAWKREA